MIEKICILALAQLIFFAKTVTYKYTSDDIPVWQESKKLQLGFFKKAFLMIEGSIRTTTQADHFLTTLIHAAVSILVYLAFGANDVSYAAAWLFAFNPINNQGSVWISGRTYPLTTLLYLTAFTFPLAAPATTVLAMHYPIGFCMAWITVLISPYMLIPFAVGILIYQKRFRGLIANKVKKEMFAADKKIDLIKAVYAIKTFAFYTVHALIPIKTTFYHSFMQSMAGSGKAKAGKLDRYFWSGLIFIALIIYQFTRPWSMVSFGLLWWIAGIAPFLNTFRLSQEIAERYAYVPLPGLMFVLASILAPYPQAIIALVSIYACRLWFYMDAFHDDYYLVEQACLNSPDSWFAWHIRALRRWDVESHKEAMILWTMAKMIHPRECKVLFNLATMLKLHKQDKEAEAFLKEAEKNVPPGQEEEYKQLFKDWRKGRYQVLI